MLKSIILTSLFCWSYLAITAQNWQLKNQKKGISVYVKNAKDSKIKEVRMAVTLKSSLQEIVSVLENIKQYPTWMYNCKSGETIIVKGEKYNRTTIDFPFPTSDRDIVTFSVKKQGSLTFFAK